MRTAHRLRNRVILGAFIASVIADVLEAAGVLPRMGMLPLLLASMFAYGLVVAIAVMVRYAVTGKNVHQP